MKNLTLLFLLWLLGLNAGFSQDFGQLPDTVYISVNSHDTLSAEFADMAILEMQRAFVVNNSRRKHSRYLALAPTLEEADMQIFVHGILFPTKQQRNTALMLSVVGIGVPVVLAASGVPIPVAMYFTSNSQYMVSYRYSDFMKSIGFNDMEQTPLRISTGYVRRPSRGYTRISKAMGMNMIGMARGWNKAYRKATR